MSRRNSRRAPLPGAPKVEKIWCWSRRIDSRHQDEWISRLAQIGCSDWAVTQKPDQVRSLLTAYITKRQVAHGLVQRWHGKSALLNTSHLLKKGAGSVLEFGPALRIFHEEPIRGKRSDSALYIPHGLAFGSGEHGTTSMLLRELCRRRSALSEAKILDLGTGSGILALSARFLGAKKIVAMDFDVQAIATARRNERLNFRDDVIQWHRRNVTSLRARERYDLVLANLYSGILCEAAVPIAACVNAMGELWISGVLRTQQAEVTAAYERTGLRLIRTLRRGKWVMLQWQHGEDRQEAAGGLKNKVQTK